MTNPILCKRCNGRITFHRNQNGKLEPVELDGSAHWEKCKRRQERLAAEFLRSVETKVRHPAAKPPRVTYPTTEVTHAWAGELPPWDESLGPSRNFTAKETAAGKACRPLDRPAAEDRDLSPSARRRPNGTMDRLRRKQAAGVRFLKAADKGLGQTETAPLVRPEQTYGSE